MPPRKRQARAKTTLSNRHKDALAEGRRQGNAVRRYLVALEENRPRRGRQVSKDSLVTRRAEIDGKIANADPLKRAHLIQQRRDLDRRLVNVDDTHDVDIKALEDAFVLVAAEYGARKHIEYKTWREVGVPASVLARAGIHWSRRG